jgi:hypothetical protein
MRIALRLLAFPTAVALAVPLLAAPALAADPAPQAVFYEVTENMKLKDGKIVRRAAVSALAGTAVAGSGFCPPGLVDPSVAACDLTAIGGDSISLATGLGPFTASITAVVQGDNPVDGPELVVGATTVVGKMDFSPAVLHGIPYGTVTGKTGLITDLPRTKFHGVFRLPFLGSAVVPNTGGLTARQLLCDPAHQTPNPLLGGPDVIYLGTTNGVPDGTCIDVRPEELSLNVPMVRFELWFD